MPRIARTVAIGVPHHVTQRGNNRQDVFFNDHDRRLYLHLLGQRCLLYDLKIYGYCLMTNHVHLVVLPNCETSMARAIGESHCSYSRRINALYGRVGHLWQNRFYSCPVDSDLHLVNVLLYAERNPQRAGIVRAAWEYEWSSAAAHCGSPDPSRLLDLRWWHQVQDPAEWRRALVCPDDESVLQAIRDQTLNGRPLGDERFVENLESRLGRSLTPRPIGRPRKQRDRGDS